MVAKRTIAGPTHDDEFFREGDSNMSHDVFLSWADPDRAKAAATKRALEKNGLRVFWSHRIRPGDDWLYVIKRKLDTIPCLVVLWSRNSVNSTWVRSEAGEAAERGILIPVLIEDVQPPQLFRRFQSQNLVNWRGGARNTGLISLVERIQRRVNASTDFYEWFTELSPDDDVTEEDLALIDSTWVVPPSADETYHVHIIVHGHESTLSRISKVVYFLEGWVNGQYRTSTNSKRNFELHEHAWSHFAVKATVKFKNQEAVVLRRFIHLTPEGPSLEPFMRAGSNDVTGR